MEMQWKMRRHPLGIPRETEGKPDTTYDFSCHDEETQWKMIHHLLGVLVENQSHMLRSYLGVLIAE